MTNQGDAEGQIIPSRVRHPARPLLSIPREARIIAQPVKLITQLRNSSMIRFLDRIVIKPFHHIQFECPREIPR